MLISPRLEVVCHVMHMYFGLSLYKADCAKFHHCRICVTGFRVKTGKTILPPTCFLVAKNFSNIFLKQKPIDRNY